MYQSTHISHMIYSHYIDNRIFEMFKWTLLTTSKISFLAPMYTFLTAKNLLYLSFKAIICYFGWDGRKTSTSPSKLEFLCRDVHLINISQNFTSSFAARSKLKLGDRIYYCTTANSMPLKLAALIKLYTQRFDQTIFSSVDAHYRK